MLHLFYFVTRKTGMTDADFHHYWRDTHGPIVAEIDELNAYLQSHAITGSQVNTDYDGAADTPVRGIAFSGLTFSHADRRAWVDEEIAAMPEVSYLIMVSGEYDLMVEVFCRDRR